MILSFERVRRNFADCEHFDAAVRPAENLSLHIRLTILLNRPVTEGYTYRQGR
jgi:hypothetical protein